MRVIIAGSRNITNIEIVRQVLRDIGLMPKDITEEVCGMAKGVDTLGAKIAQEHGIPVKPFPADWNKYGKRAGHLRNAEMAAYADMLVAVWDGKSPGTKNMFETMKRRNKIVHVHIYGPMV